MSDTDGSNKDAGPGRDEKLAAGGGGELKLLKDAASGGLKLAEVAMVNASDGVRGMPRRGEVLAKGVKGFLRKESGRKRLSRVEPADGDQRVSCVGKGRGIGAAIGYVSHEMSRGRRLIFSVAAFHLL